MLQQSVYVLEKLDEGLTIDEVIIKCDGDEQGVSIWINFLSDLGWILKNTQPLSPPLLSSTNVPNVSTFQVAELGKLAIEKYGKSVKAVVSETT